MPSSDQHSTRIDPRVVFSILIAIGAVPVACALAQQGHGLAVRQTWPDLAWLVALGISEELVFRGGLQTMLLRRPTLAAGWLGISGANGLTSLVFSAAHLWAHAPWHALGVLPVSLLLGASLEQTGRLWVPTALHVWFNLTLYAASAWMVVG